VTNYNKSTDFTVKDVLLTGNPNKLVKGSEVDVEFSNMELADATNVKKTGNTGSAVMPVGTTAQRDVAPAVGYTRVNTSTGTLEWWNGTIWTSANGGDAYDIEVTTATGGQTVITTGNNFIVGSNTLMVYLNGLLVNKTTDYTETTTTSFTFNSGLTVGDEVVAQIWRTNISTSGDAMLVSYQAAGTGAVATTVQSKLRESVSVKDFGAVGDGVTDDTAAIQTCINGVPVATVIDLCGLTYLVTGIDVTKQGVTLINGKLITNAATARALVKVTADDVTIDAVDVYIDSAAHASSCGAIGFDGADNGKVLNCKLDGAKRTGAASVNAHQVAIFNGCDNIIVDGCTILNGVFTEHIYVDASTNCRITNNTISNGSYSAVALVSALNTSGNHVVSNNTMHTFGTSIVTVDCDDCVVSGNTIYGSTAEQGVNVAHVGSTTGNRTVIVGNTISDCPLGYGVGVTDSKNVLVANNQIFDAVNGVRIANTSDECAVVGNVISSTTGSGVLFSIGDLKSQMVVKSNLLSDIDDHGIECNGGTTYEVTGNTLINIHNTSGGLPGGRMLFYWDGSTGTNKPAVLTYTNNIASTNASLVGTGPNRGIDIRNSIAALRVTASGNDYTSVISEDFYTTGTAPTQYGDDFSFAWTPTLTTNTGTFGALTVTAARAKRVGNFLHVQVACSATVSSGSPAEFRLSYPNGWTGLNSSIYAPAYITVAGANEIGVCRQTNGSYFSFYRPTFAAYTGAVTVTGTFIFEMA